MKPRGTQADRKTAIRDLLLRLAALAERMGQLSLARDLRDERVPKLDKERMTVVAVGEFNRGKSTLLNALLGAPLLPVGPTPTTAALTHVRYGDQKQAAVVFESGARQSTDPDRLLDVLGVDAQILGNPGDAVAYVDVTMPAAILQDGIELVDTPGVNDLGAQRQEITYGTIPRADVILFLLDATQILSASERTFLQDHVLRSSRDRLLFVVTKIDRCTPDELVQAVAFARKHLGELAIEAPVFPVSAKLNGQNEDAGLAALRAHLLGVTASARGRLVLDHAVADLARLGGFLRQCLVMRRRSLALPIDELKNRRNRVEDRLRTGKRALGEAKAHIVASQAALKARVAQDLAAFASSLQTALLGEIDQVDAPDLQRFLGPFLEHVWRQWLQSQGTIIGDELQRMAESIIEIANQKADEVLGAVTAELNVGAARIDLGVDTFKYDASIFALGALGTTIFLFVNTLAGGLLALAAPISAVLLRGRMAKDLKDEAKQRAPEAVQRIAAVLAPKLDQIVDGFVARLDAFIADAGVALGRGISELLDAAVKERAGLMAAADQVSAQEGLDQQEADLKRVLEDAVEIRQALWI